MKLIDEYDFYMALSVGIQLTQLILQDLEWIESLAQHPKVIGIGEMGLGSHWDKSPADVQKEVFRKQIALAKRLKLPIIIHNP